MEEKKIILQKLLQHLENKVALTLNEIWIIHLIYNEKTIEMSLDEYLIHTRIEFVLKVNYNEFLDSKHTEKYWFYGLPYTYSEIARNLSFYECGFIEWLCKINGYTVEEYYNFVKSQTIKD